MKYILLCMLFIGSLSAIDENLEASKKATEQGFALLHEMKPKEAVPLFQKAIIFDNAYAEAHLGLGLSYFQLKDYKEAVRRFKTALVFDDTLMEAWDYLGLSYELIGDLEKALSTYFKALNMDPQFSKHSSRFSINIPVEILPSNIERREEQIKTLRKASSLEGKKIYVENDTPLMDTLLFARFLDELYYTKKAHVYFEPGAKLQTLFSKGMPHIEIVDWLSLDADQVFDYKISLSALPIYFETTLKTIPYPKGYLSLEPPLETHKTGIAWRFDSEDPQSKAGFTLDQLLALAPAGSSLYLLQESPRAVVDNLIPLGFRGQSLDDLRGIISQMDFVIAVDGTIARLAAAMGKKVLLILPTPCQWVWFIEGKTTPWFKNVELKRVP
ncbi:MAG: tetratricopeptide repeat protein [Chlamydiota bacterium]